MERLSLRDWKLNKVYPGFLEIICEHEHHRPAFQRIGVEWDAFLIWVSHSPRGNGMRAASHRSGLGRCGTLARRRTQVLGPRCSAPRTFSLDTTATRPASPTWSKPIMVAARWCAPHQTGMGL